MTLNATINVSVSSHYREATYASEVTSQGILGERVEIIERGELFTKIRQTDGYTSWISTDQVYEDIVSSDETVLVKSHFLRIHEKPSKDSAGIRDAVIGCKLGTNDANDDWYMITLPDGIKGWAEKKHFGLSPAATPDNILQIAKEFLGYQYVWGGRSPKGFDCSGFVQTVFGLHGIALPRDSWQQQEQHQLSEHYRDAQPGDLLFFGKTPDKVTHVAISLGNERFIHASGWVRYNSFRKSDADYSKEHIEKFISVNRYPFA